MKKENVGIRNIAHQIQINQQMYDVLLDGPFEQHIVRMFQRLKMQKKLFIKEIANATDISRTDLINEGQINDKSTIASILNKCDTLIKNKNVEACISLLIENEQMLYDQYNNLLYENKTDEITKMILRNQSNEIKRDILILKDLHEYA